MRWDALITGALGAVLGVVAGLALAPRPSSSATGPASGAGAPSEAVLSELRAIRALLEERGSPLVAPGDADGLAPVDAAPPGTRVERLDADPLVAALRSLEQAVRAGGTGGGTAAPAAGLRVSEGDLAAPLGADLAALRATRATMKGEVQQVLPDLFGLSPAQVYQRFGTPAVVGNSPGRVRWMYRDPDYPGYLVITFLDGYVGWIHVAAE